MISILLFCALIHAELRTPTQPVVAVYLDFDNTPSPVSVDFMKQEAAAIMKPAGLELLWRDGSQSDTHESFPNLVVVRFRGRCDDAPTLFGTYAPEAQAAALASTAVSEGHVLPFSEVACDAVRRYIASGTRGQNDYDCVLGRALGRGDGS